jgi:serine/threonine protein kinase
MDKRDIWNEVASKFHLTSFSQFRVFGPTGDELDDEDLEYIDGTKPIFVSDGEDFDKSTCLAIYKKVRTLGRGGFGVVRLYQHRITKELVAIKFVKFGNSPERISRVFKEI